VASTDFEIRPLRTTAECHAAVALQRDVWGNDYTDVVPASFLHVVEYVGGLAAGAFDANGAMAGFVFGVNGVRDGEIVHWSHMLGVTEAARNSGLGRLLKEYQRDTLRELGVTRIFWTFDPLMSKNAYFNIRRLGAEVVEYVPDMYGSSASKLHLGLATDRLIACLRTTPRAPSAAVSIAGAPVLSPFPRLDDFSASICHALPDVALIETPTDILELLSRSPEAAKTWRLAVRDHFKWAMANDYEVVGVEQDRAQGRFFYVVQRRGSSPSE